MAKTKIGKVGITPKGAYSNVKNYVRLDVVTENGSSYVCLNDCVGKAVTDTEYWQLVAEKGDKGDKPVTGVDYNTDAEKTEFKNEVVTETKTDIADYVTEQKTELNTYTETKKSELDEYESTKETELNTKATELTNAFNTNATSKTKDYNDNATAKTTAFNNNTTEKITAYNDNATTKTNEFNENVDSLNNKITKLENENDDLYNALYTEKTNGTETYIDDAKKCRLVNTEIDGKYKQDGTTGKQLLNVNLDTTTKNGITLTRNADGTYTANGTATATAFFVIGTFNFAANTNYILNGCPAGGAITTYQILLADTANAYDVGNGYNCNFEEDTVKNIVIRIQNGVTVNNIVFKPMISSTGGDYEKYTGSIASPNPDYPQEIEMIDTLQLKTVGTNLFDYTKISADSSATSGITIKLEENGDIAISGKPKASYFQVVPNQDITSILKDGETYFLKQSNANDYSCFRLELNAIKEDGGITYLSAANGLRSFVVDKTTFKKYVIKVICGNLSDWGTGEKNIVSNFALIRQKKSDFEKYVSKTINIDLKGNKLCSVSDTIKDKLLIDKNGNVVLQKNVGKVIFKGNERWELTEKGFYNSSYFIAQKNKKIFEACCNYFLVNKTSQSWTGLNYCGFNASGYFWIQEEHKLATSSGEFSNWLTTHNLEVYYALATPELIDLGQLTELPKTFEGINNIWAETNLGNTEIEIEYVQDVKKLIEQTQAMIINNASEEVTE